jgi:hypothetical protein
MWLIVKRKVGAVGAQAERSYGRWPQESSEMTPEEREESRRKTMFVIRVIAYGCVMAYFVTRFLQEALRWLSR